MDLVVELVRFQYGRNQGPPVDANLANSSKHVERVEGGAGNAGSTRRIGGVGRRFGVLLLELALPLVARGVVSTVQFVMVRFLVRRVLG